jgi:hypothetical protein
VPALIVLIGVLVAGCATAPPVPPVPVTAPSHPLVGEWRGRWENLYNQGDLRFTVTRVDAGRVEGTASIPGNLPYHGYVWPFAGTLEGDHLTGEIPTAPRGPTIYWDLTVGSDGRILSGRGLSQPTGANAVAIWSRLSLSKTR